MCVSPKETPWSIQALKTAISFGVYVVPGRYTEGFGEQAAGHPGADDGDAHECA